MSVADSAAAGATGDEKAWSVLLRRIISLSTLERDLRSTLRQVAELVVATTGADACFVHVVDHEAGEVVLMGATPEEFDRLAGTIRLRIGEGLAGWTAAHGTTSVVENKWDDPRYVYIPELKGEEYRSLVSVPLLRPERRVVGVLNVHAREPGHFGEATAPRLEEVASLLAGIVENAVLYDRLATREAQLARFAAEVVELQESDRRRVAADIHDGISQRLVSAWYRLRAARSFTGEERALAELDATETLLSDALDEARRAITGLRPVVLDDLGLAAALSSLAGTVGGGAEIELDLDDCSLAPHLETVIYRVAQESLQNVVKHARATTVRLSLTAGAGVVTLAVADDGGGFDPDEDRDRVSFGLSGMAERASLVGGRLEVRSSPGAGTTVLLTVPAVPAAEG